MTLQGAKEFIAHGRVLAGMARAAIECGGR